MAGPISPQREAGPRNRALRLWFEYKRNCVKLLSIRRLTMIPPPPQALARQGGGSRLLRIAGQDRTAAIPAGHR